MLVNAVVTKNHRWGGGEVESWWSGKKACRLMENPSCFGPSGLTGPASMSDMDPAPIELKRPHRGRSALLWGFENKTWGSAKRKKKRTQKAFSHHRRFSYQMTRPPSPPPGQSPSISRPQLGRAEISPAQPLQACTVG